MSIRIKIEKIKRACSAFIHEYNNPDWDYGFVLNTLQWKLKRLQKELENTNIVQDKHLLVNNCKYMRDMLDKIIQDEFITNRCKELIIKKYYCDKCDDSILCHCIVNNLTIEEENELTEEILKGLTIEEQEWNKFCNFMKKNLKSMWI